MKTRLIMYVMLVIGLWSSGFAQIDPHPDGMSIYFDIEATQFCHELGPDFQQVTAYLILTRPSTSEPAIMAWEARLEVEGNPIVPIPSSWAMPHEYCWWCNGPDYIVGTTSPPLAITGDATVLAWMVLTFIGTEVDPYATFTIGRCTGSITFPDGPGYTSEIGYPIPCQHIFGAWGTPCAWINKENCEQVIANEVMTWGTVKALY